MHFLYKKEKNLSDFFLIFRDEKKNLKRWQSLFSHCNKIKIRFMRSYFTIFSP